MFNGVSVKARLAASAVALAAGTIVAVTGTAHADTSSPSPTDTSSPAPVVCVCHAPVVAHKVATPQIIGTAQVGKKLTAKILVTWASTATKTTYRYQWLANGRKIKGATKATFIVPASLRGKKLRCRDPQSLRSGGLPGRGRSHKDFQSHRSRQGLS